MFIFSVVATDFWDGVLGPTSKGLEGAAEKQRPSHTVVVETI
jgi:hypothetical protein